MKRCVVLLTFLLALGPFLRAQRYTPVADTLSARLERRMGVAIRLRIEKVLTRGGEQDFYFGQELADYPWRKGDVAWFRRQLTQLVPDCKVGEIYAKKQRLEPLEMPAIHNDGTPEPNAFRVTDPRRSVTPLVQGADYWPLGMSGRHIALWQSHGRFWDGGARRWNWQRSVNNRTIEDLYTQSYVLPFLIPMLENAGAVVMTPRERDTQRWEVVCDNDPAWSGAREGTVRRKGSYHEKGSWSDAGTGFADARAEYRNLENPFTMGTARMAPVTPSNAQAAGLAVWRPHIPEKGEYAVYVSYKSLNSSTTDARYTVHHLGGSTLLHVNQQMGGGTWIYLGTFLFDEGTAGYVELSTRSSGSGVVTADAVRFGGGMGKVNRGGGISGLPAYLEGALCSMQYGGLDLSLLDEWDDDYTKDYAGRGVWVQALGGGSRTNPEGEGAHIPFDFSFAFHTDAGVTPDEQVVGTLAIYSRLCDRSEELPNGESRMNGRMAADMVQTQIVDDIRAQFNGNWTRRGTWDRSYSESRTTGVPAFLLELLSHQNFSDMRYGLDPLFRFTVSRAVYKGMLKYLSSRYGCNYVVQPLPVHAFRADLKDGRAVLSWQPTLDSLEETAVAEYYRIYTRLDDGGFDDGRQVDGNRCELPLEKGRLYSFKVVACNRGGMSFPSEILSVAVTVDDAPQVVVVNDFTRVAPPASFDTPLYAGFLDDLDSGVPWGKDILFSGSMNQFRRDAAWISNDSPGFTGSYNDQAGSQLAGNTFDFVAQHARALLAAGYSVSSSSAEAFDGVSSAFAADLICGKQVTTLSAPDAVCARYTVFPEAFQAALRRYTAAGGNVILSGAYIATDAWDAVYQGVQKAPESTRNFIREVLGYRWVTNFGDRSGRAAPLSSAPMPLPAMTYNRDWSSSVYRVESPDGIAPAGKQARTLMRYEGSQIGAAVAFDGPGYRCVSFGFPLETSPQMTETLASVLRYFLNR
ncbi:MAG: xanthan lyase [Bacteroidales bacterium]|nr:xanthan lyase [Bacteroidales bacterium]